MPVEDGQRWLLALVLAYSLACPRPSGAAVEEARAAAPLRTLLGGEYWHFEPTPEYVDYLAQVKPDVIHAGVLGPELASVVLSAPEKKDKGVTELFPTAATTMRAYHDWWKAYLPEIQEHGIKVQATFSLINAWGDHEQNTGWFRYYREGWEEDLLGPRPRPNAADLMEHDAGGQMIRGGEPGWYRYSGCVNNPHWRAALKAMVRAGVDAGFDGFMLQFPHARGPCACRHCQPRFRAFLQRKYTADGLARRFGIRDLDSHVFEATGPRPGSRAGEQVAVAGGGIGGPIDIEAQQFSAESIKDCFDEVFVHYGRSLDPDLVVSMWTHFREFLLPDETNTDFKSVIDERLLLPVERWGEGEGYLWYCSPVYQSKLAEGLLGDSTLDYRYTRAMAGDRPFVIQKYDHSRWRLPVSEAVAHGGIAWGAWKGSWSGGSDREDPHLGSYFRFIRERDDFLRPRDSAAEAALLFPRTALYSGDATFLEPVRRLGAGLMSAHVLFDMLIDEKMTPEALARYRLIVVPTHTYLSDPQRRMLSDFMAEGGCVVALGSAAAPARTESSPSEVDASLLCRCGVDGVGRPAAAEGSVVTLGSNNRAAVGEALRALAGPGLSRFEAPWEVQVAADRQPARNRTILHLINYNRDDRERGRELPIPAQPVGVDLRLNGDAAVRAVRFFTPEVEGEQKVEFRLIGGRIQFRTPGFLVYGMAVVEHE